MNFKISELKELFLKKGTFLKNISYLIAGNGLGIVITFVSTPIISRIYNPEDYGDLSLYISIVQVIGILATLQLTRVFVLPPKESEFKKLFKLTTYLVVFSSLLLFLVVIISDKIIIKHYNLYNPQWLYFIPVSVLLFGIHDIARSYNERTKNFKKIASSKVLSTLISKGSSISYALLLSPNFWGLFIGELVIRPIEIFFQLPQKVYAKLKCFNYTLSFKELFNTLKTYKSTPIFYLPAIWVINFSSQVPIYLIAYLYSSVEVGYFGMANSLLNLPLSLLVNSIAPVFTQRIAEEKDINKIRNLSQSMIERIFYLSLIPNIVILFFSTEIFKFFLGTQWVKAGELASYMSLYYLILGLNSVYGLYIIMRKESLYLIVNIFNLFLCGASLYIGYIFFNNITYSIFIYSAAVLFGNLIHLFFCYKLIGTSILKMFRIPLLIILCIILIQIIKLVY